MFLFSFILSFIFSQVCWFESVFMASMGRVSLSRLGVNEPFEVFREQQTFSRLDIISQALMQYKTQFCKYHKNLEFCHRDSRGPQEQNSVAESKMRWLVLIVCSFQMIWIFVWPCVSRCISMMLVLKSLITTVFSDLEGKFYTYILVF